MNPDAAAIDTTDDEMSLSGIAGSDIGVSGVSWKSDKGSQGVASGTDRWDIGSIPLELGANTITVMATNAAGETRADTIVIRRETEGKGSITLSWIAPTHRTDNTPLSNLAGYRISYGRMSGVHDYEVKVPNPGIATYVVEGLVPGDWYFSLAAYDASGLESALSNEVRFTVP